VTYSSEETLEPQRTLPRALVAGVCIVTAAYVALNLVYLYVLPLDQVAASTRIAADAAQAVTGSSGGGIVSAIVLFSAAGSLTGIVLAGPRVYYAMAQDGLAFRWLGQVHPVYRTPHRAIVLQAAWAAVLVATGTFRVLFTRVIYTEWLFFGLMALGLLAVRRRPDLKRQYSMWGFPALPVVFGIASLGIVVHHVWTDPRESLFGLGLVGLGLPVYYLWGRRAVRETTP